MHTFVNYCLDHPVSNAYTRILVPKYYLLELWYMDYELWYDMAQYIKNIKLFS